MGQSLQIINPTRTAIRSVFQDSIFSISDRSGKLTAELPHLNSSQIVELRPSVDRLLPGSVPNHYLLEKECADKSGKVADILTVLLRGSECQFRCLMCDLWKGTHLGKTPLGALPAQIAHALDAVRQNTLAAEFLPAQAPQKAAEWIKLYNASNFFSDYNVPRGDLPGIAELVNDFDRVIVENHPKLLNDRILQFRDGLGGRLEIAMGLETVHAETLAALNKQMRTEDFASACQWLSARSVDVRAFVLLRPPGMSEQEGIEWCIKSVEFASQHGVRHVSLIPMRGGNGAIEHLNEHGLFQAPLARSLEDALAVCQREFDCIVTADLWDWKKLRGRCSECDAARIERMQTMNLRQEPVAPQTDAAKCSCC